MVCREDTRTILNCLTATGEEHKHNICQDASACWSNSRVSIVVVSDGHSDSDCEFSNDGSSIAVECAIDILSESLSRKTSNTRIREDGDSYLNDLGTSIIEEWEKRTLDDYIHVKNRSPDSDDVKNKTYKIKYGATIVMAAITSDYVIGLQIGDGRIYTLFKDGRVTEPLMLDPKCHGEMTTSLSDLNPNESLHYFFRQVEDIVGIAVCTDGFTNCYSEEDCQKEIRHIFSELDVGNSWYTTTSRRLFELTKKSYKDDVSISIACKEDADYTLFEALSTNKIPKLEHGTCKKIYSKKCTNGVIEGGKFIERNSIIYDGTYYYDTRKHGNYPLGKMEDGNIQNGSIAFLNPFANNKSNYSLCPPKESIFWTFNSNPKTRDYSKIRNSFRLLDNTGDVINYTKPNGRSTATEINMRMEEE